MKTRAKKSFTEASPEEWDEKAKATQCFFGSPSTQYYRNSEIGMFGEFFPPLKGRRVLKSDLWNEVNNTRILGWLAEQGAQVYGFDISSYLVENTKKNFREAGLKADIRKSDMRKLPYRDNYFDCIYSMGTIEHIPDYEKAVGEFYRVLKPGGVAIIGTPNTHDPFLRPLMVWFLELFGKYPYSPELSFTKRELKEILEHEGFKVTAYTGILFFPGMLRILDVFFYKSFRPLSIITKLALMPFEMLERNSAYCRRHGYLVACVATKR